MSDDRDDTIGELADSIEPGETIRFDGLDLTRWPEPAEPTFAGPNRATRRGNKLHPRSAGRRADYRPGTTRPGPSEERDMPYPKAWVDAAADAAHKALDEVDDGWHYTCTHDPDDQSCSKGDAARAMLTEDVIPRVLDTLREAGAL
jgi:hypothetical protein